MAKNKTKTGGGKGTNQYVTKGSSQSRLNPPTAPMVFPADASEPTHPTIESLSLLTNSDSRSASRQVYEDLVMAAIDPTRSAEDREHAYTILKHDFTGPDDDAFYLANETICNGIESVVEQPEGPVDLVGALRLSKLADLAYTAKDFEPQPGE